MNQNKELMNLKNKSKLKNKVCRNNISIEERESILRGLNDVKNGKTFKHCDVKNKYLQTS